MAADSPASEASCGSAARVAGQQDGIPGGSPSLDQPFDAGSLYLLRAAVAAHASAAGLGPPRVYDVVAAVHELAANAVRHGAGAGRLRLHCDGLVLSCEVSDDGPGARNGRPGPGPGGAPLWPVEHGHGLWVIEQVADAFRVEHGPAGTTATACFTVSPSRAGDETTTSHDQELPADRQEESAAEWLAQACAWASALAIILPVRWLTIWRMVVRLLMVLITGRAAGGEAGRGWWPWWRTGWK